MFAADEHAILKSTHCDVDFFALWYYARVDSENAAVLKPEEFRAEDRLRDLTELIERVARARGWTCKVVARDETKHRYATLSVSRMLEDTHRLVTGTFELTSVPKATIGHRVTSMYDEGFGELVESITTEFAELPWFKGPVRRQRGGSEPVENAGSGSVTLLTGLLRRFHRVVRQLRDRHDNRATLPIQDEYDVQDLLHAILRGLSDDVRAEEYTPSYAGGASRVDFLLKDEHAAVEVKVASARLRDKQVGDSSLILRDTVSIQIAGR